MLRTSLFFAALAALVIPSVSTAQIPLPGASWRFGHEAGPNLNLSPNGTYLAFSSNLGYMVTRRDGSVVGDHPSATWISWLNNSAEYLMVDRDGVVMRSSSSGNITRTLTNVGQDANIWPVRTPAGDLFILVGKINTIEKLRWDGTQLQFVTAFANYSDFLGISPNGRYLAYDTGADTRIVDLQTNLFVSVGFRLFNLDQVSFSSDSNRMFNLSFGTNRLQAFNTATGQIVFERDQFGLDNGFVTPDGLYMIGKSSITPPRAEKRRVSDGSLVWRHDVFPEPGYQVDPFGNLVFPKNGAVRFISGATTSFNLPSIGQGGGVYGYEPPRSIVSANGSQLLVTGGSGVVELRLASTGQRLRSFGPFSSIGNIAATPDFSRLVVHDDQNDKFFVYNVSNGQLLNPAGIPISIFGVRFAVRGPVSGQNARLYYVDGASRRIIAYDLVTFNAVQTINLPAGTLNNYSPIAISPDGLLLAVHFQDNVSQDTIRIYNTVDGTFRQALNGVLYSELQFSPADSGNLYRLIARAFLGDLTLFESVGGTWSQRTTLDTNEEFVNFLPNGRVIATGGRRKVRFLRVPELTPIQTWQWIPEDENNFPFLRNVSANGDRVFVMRDDNLLSAINHPYSVILNNFTAPATLFGGSTGTGNVFLNRATNAPRVVQLQRSNPALTIPSSATIPVGSLNQTFTITAANPAVATDVDIIASNIVNITRRVRVLPGLTTMSVTPATVKGGSPSTGRVNLAGNAAPGTVVTLGENSNFASVPGTVTVPTTQNFATFNVTTTAVTSNQAVTVSATLGTVTRTTKLTITP